MPGGRRLPGASDLRERQYEHIKESYIAHGKAKKVAKKLAAMTVNKQRAEHGETKKVKNHG